MKNEMNRFPRRDATGGFTRRNFMRGAAGAASAGLVLGKNLFLPKVARASSAPTQPNPIPLSTALPFGSFHFLFPGPSSEPSLITDFNGFIGVIDFTGMGSDGQGNRLPYRGDNRFMSGEYVGVDGRLHHGTFAFI